MSSITSCFVLLQCGYPTSTTLTAAFITCITCYLKRIYWTVTSNNSSDSGHVQSLQSYGSIQGCSTYKSVLGQAVSTQFLVRKVTCHWWLGMCANEKHIAPQNCSNKNVLFNFNITCKKKSETKPLTKHARGRREMELVLSWFTTLTPYVQQNSQTQINGTKI